jgi:hypothetical protein
MQVLVKSDVFEAVRNFVHNDNNKAIESMVHTTLEEITKECQPQRSENGEDEAEAVSIEKLVDDKFRDRWICVRTCAYMCMPGLPPLTLAPKDALFC